VGDQISYLRFVHGDTNILSEFAKKQELWKPLQDFLHENDLCLAVSGAQAAELSSIAKLHEPLNTLLTAVPSALIKSAETILQEEIDAYPNARVKTLLQYPLNALFGKASPQKRQHTHSVWQKDPSVIDLWSHKFIRQKPKYLHLNPVRAGLCEHPAEWKWSSYRAYLPHRQGEVPIEVDWRAYWKDEELELATGGQ